MTLHNNTGEVYTLSNSEIQTYKDCRRKWWLSYYRRLKPKQNKFTGPLALGSRVHEALDQYYSTEIPLLEAYANLIEDDRIKIAEDGRDPSELDSEGDLGRIMLEGYLQWIDEEGIDSELEMISTEEVLKMPMFNGEVELQGKIDMRVRRKVDGVRMFRDFKAQPLTESIATPLGWTTMGALEIGSVILGQGFIPTTVLGTYDLGEDTVYKLTFNDGTSVRASGDHLWEVKRYGKTAVLKTSELRFGKKNAADRISPIDADTSTAEALLPVDPYLLGIWLADGGRHQVQSQTHNVPIAQGDFSVATRITEITGVPVSVTAPTEGRNKVNLYTNQVPIAMALMDLGLSTKYSAERFIPLQFIRGGYTQRLDLLRGLMDGDGLVATHSNSTQYVSTSEDLANDVASLVRSLGGWAKVVKNISPNYYIKADKTKVYTGTYSYRVVIRIGVNPFSGVKAPRWDKKNSESLLSYRPRLAYARDKVIMAIEPDGVEAVRCIRVSADDSLYVTSGYTLTHNTVGGSFDQFYATANMNEQILTYMLLEQHKNGEGERSEGGLFTLLKKVKRTANAKPPFYDQYEVRHNIFSLRSFWTRLHGTVTDLMRTKTALDAGESHLGVAYPTPSRDCTWKCQFFSVCTLIDDGSAAENAIAELFVEADPYAYYGTNEQKGSE